MDDDFTVVVIISLNKRGKFAKKNERTQIQSHRLLIMKKKLFFAIIYLPC